MKKGDSFELSYAWWHSEGAVTLPKTGLGKALKAYEAADKKFESANSNDGAAYMKAYLDVKTALEDVDAARLGAIKMCKEAIHKETKEALQKDAVITQREKKLLLDVTNELLPVLQDMEGTLGLIDKAVTLFDKTIKDASDPKLTDEERKKLEETCVNMYANVGKRVQLIDGRLERFPKGNSFQANFSTMGARLEKILKARKEIKLKAMYESAKEAFGPKLKLKEIN